MISWTFGRGLGGPPGILRPHFHKPETVAFSAIAYKLSSMEAGMNVCKLKELVIKFLTSFAVAMKQNNSLSNEKLSNKHL